MSGRVQDVQSHAARGRGLAACISPALNNACSLYWVYLTSVLLEDCDLVTHEIQEPAEAREAGWLSKATRVRWQIPKTQIVYPPISKPMERHQDLYSLLPCPLLFLAVVLHAYPRPVPWVILCPKKHVENWFGPRRRSSQRAPPAECPAPVFLVELVPGALCSSLLSIKAPSRSPSNACCTVSARLLYHIPRQHDSDDLQGLELPPQGVSKSRTHRTHY